MNVSGSKIKVFDLLVSAAEEKRIADLACGAGDGDGGFHFIEMRWASVREAGFFLLAEALRTAEFTEKRK